MEREKIIEQLHELIVTDLESDKKDKALYCLVMIDKIFKEPDPIFTFKCKTPNCNADPIKCKNCGAEVTF